MIAKWVIGEGGRWREVCERGGWVIEDGWVIEGGG